MKGGAKVWYYPDGYLPAPNSVGTMEPHEALMLFNTSEENAVIFLDFYFSVREPLKNIQINVGKERIIALRLDHPEDIGGVKIPPLTQYAIRVRSSVEIVAQFGRLDTTQNNMAYYGTIGYSES